MAYSIPMEVANFRRYVDHAINRMVRRGGVTREEALRIILETTIELVKESRES